MWRASSPLRDEVRLQKRFCPPRTRSPHSNLSQPPLEVWCAERVYPRFSSVWQLGDAFVSPPLQPVLSPPAGRVLGDTVGSLLQRSDPVPASRQSSTSLSVNPSKNADGSPSWWRVPLLPGLLDTPSHVSNFTACLARFKLGCHVSIVSCRRLLGLMAAASPVLPLGLLHMRPFLWWRKELRLHPTVPATRLIRVSRSCSRPLLQWRDPAFLRSGVRIGAIHRRHMVTTDASMTGWGAVFEGRPASGEWTGEFLSWHINCLELRAVFLALMFFSRSPGASYHSQDGQHGGCVPHKPSGRFTVAHPGQDCAPSSPLVPVRVPVLKGSSRSGNTVPRGRLSVETETQAGGMDVEPSDGIPDLGSVWRSGGGPLCFSRVIPVPALVLPEFPDDSGHRCVRPFMAECQSVRDSGSTMQSEGERCPSPSHSPILALPDLVLGANPPLVPVSLGDSGQAGLAFPASGQDLASSAGALEVVGMAHTGPRAVIDGLPAEVQETSARAPATRKLYSSKWGILNPGVWLMQLTQLTALLVQCWSFARKADSRGGCYHP